MMTRSALARDTMGAWHLPKSSTGPRTEVNPPKKCEMRNPTCCRKHSLESQVLAISTIGAQIHAVVDGAIVPRADETAVSGKLFDISAIDFDRLRAEFERSPAKRTTVINLMDAIEKRLARMMAENPTRTNFQARYEEMVTEYNEEKDRLTIEATFQALLKFVAALGEEESRAVREGLALTDDMHMTAHAERWGVTLERPTKGEPVAERTAAVIWSVLDEIDVPVFLWNVFPLHPHETQDPFSNRAHNARERSVGEEVLAELIVLLCPRRIVAIGNDAAKSAKRVAPEKETVQVRHPSYGGQTEFLLQMNALYPCRAHTLL